MSNQILRQRHVWQLGVCLLVVACDNCGKDNGGTGPTPCGSGPVYTVSISPATAALEVGDNTMLTATAKDLAGGCLSGKTITWISSNAAVASVSPSTGTTTTVTAVGQGSPATITAAASEGQPGTVTVTVTQLVATVTVRPTPSTIIFGATLQLSASVKDKHDNDVTPRPAVSWSSNNASATVDANGLVTGVSQGVAAITATSQGKSGAAQVTVVTGVTAVVVTPATPSIHIGESIVLHAAVTRDPTVSDSTVTWSSSAPTIATVDAAGKVTGISVGSATITATSVRDPTKSGTATVSVAAIPAILTVNAGDNQSATVNTQVAVHPSVVVKDNGGKGVVNIHVAFSITSGNGGVTNATQTTDANGIATVGSWTLGTIAGANTLTASVQDPNFAGNPLMFTATGLPSVPKLLASVAGDNQRAIYNTAVRVPPAVVVKDQFGNPVPGITVTWGADSPTIVVPGTQTTDAQGMATVTSWTLGLIRGDMKLGASITGAGVSGTPHTFHARSLRIIGISAGGGHTCVAVDAASGGGAYCWGANTLGQLGDGANQDQLNPVAVLNVPSPITQISAGVQHTCAIAATGVHCWGDNSAQQLLSGAADAVSAGNQFTCVLSLAAGAVSCGGADQFGQIGNGVKGTSALQTQIDVGASAVQAGGEVACDINGTTFLAYCWGHNSDGEVGDNSGVDRLTPTPVQGALQFTQIAAGDKHVCGLSGFAGPIYCWGYNIDGRLGNGTFTSSPVPSLVAVLGPPFGSYTQVAAGYTHTCAIVQSGNATCWGDNSLGQLGNGSTNPSNTPVLVQGQSLWQVIVASATGSHHTCGVATDGRVFCWGENTRGQLGDGTTSSKLQPTEVQW